MSFHNCKLLHKLKMQETVQETFIVYICKVQPCLVIHAFTYDIVQEHRAIAGHVHNNFTS